MFIKIQTLFQTHSYLLSNCICFPWTFIKIRSKLVETISSKHYITLIYTDCCCTRNFFPSNWFTIIKNFRWNVSMSSNCSKKSPPNTKSHSPKNFKPNLWRVWERVRKKTGQASFQNSMNGHFSGIGMLRFSWCGIQIASCDLGRSKRLKQFKPNCQVRFRLS